MSSQHRQLARDVCRGNHVIIEREALRHRELRHQRLQKNEFEEKIAVKDQKYFGKLREFEMKTSETLNKHKRGILNDVVHELNMQENKEADTVKKS